MTIQVDWNKECQFNVTTSNGSVIAVDSENNTAPCPTELLLSALGSCSATDVVLYLQDQGVEVESLNNTVTHTLTDSEPRLYKSANLHLRVKGVGVTEAMVNAAAQQAVSKYCHVCLMLQPNIEVTYSAEII